MNETIDVSLTDFVDFSIKAGTPKLTKVRALRERGDYHPATDYWKPLRERIPEAHEAGVFDIKQLVSFAKNYPDAKKVERYQAAVAGYRKFLGKKSAGWFSPPKAVWSPSRLRVRINPEIGLVLGERRLVLKLYFKTDKLSQQRVDVLSFLLRSQLQTKVSSNIEFGVLDVANGKAFVQSSSADLSPLLLGEATSFVAMWDALGAA